MKKKLSGTLLWVWVFAVFTLTGFLKTDDTTGVILGDSTIAERAGERSVAELLAAEIGEENKHNIISLAYGGASIQDQEREWGKYNSTRLEYVDYVFVQLGLNNVNDSASLAEIVSAYNRLLAQIDRSTGRDTKIIVATMTPAQKSWEYIYKEDGPHYQQIWKNLNEAIMGRGDYPVLYADYRINRHTKLMMDAEGNLLDKYDTGDGIHENTAARRIIAQEYDRVLEEMGFLN